MASGDSDSSLELHDITPQDTNVFDYNDSASLFPQLQAVIQDDVARLHSLLQGGKLVNINDNRGNTPLHVSILKEKRKIFDYLLKVEDIRLDVQNFEGYTPLMMAAQIPDAHYTLELLKNNVEVNAICNSEKTPLHFAVEENNRKNVEALIENGANISCQSYDEQTPLHRACCQNSDLIHLLLYKGAHTKIENLEGLIPFDLTILHCPFEVQEIVYYYTFDELGGNEINLRTLIFAMRKKSPVFFKLVENSTVIYNDVDLTFLCDVLPEIPPQMFRVFIDKCDDVVDSLFQMYNMRNFLLLNWEEFPLEFIYVLCESRFIEKIVASSEDLFFIDLLKTFSKEDMLTLACCVLSYGYAMSTMELYLIFVEYGYGELFTFALHMDVPCFSHSHLFQTLPVFAVPGMIHDCTITIDVLYKFNSRFDWTNIPMMDDLYKFFKNRRLVVPSLVELAREECRRHLIRKFEIRKAGDFLTVLKRLPIYQKCRDILSYKEAIYC